MIGVDICINKKGILFIYQNRFIMKASNYFLTLLFLILTIAAKASGDIGITAVPVGSSSFILILPEGQTGMAFISLKDQSGEVLHEEAVNLYKANNREYNLESLPIGKYILIVEYNDVLNIQPINKATRTLKIEQSERKTIFEPTFRSTPGYMEVSLNSTPGFNLFFTIVDSDGNHIYSEKFESNEDFIQRFNLTKLKMGTYTFLLTLEGEGINRMYSEELDYRP